MGLNNVGVVAGCCWHSSSQCAQLACDTDKVTLGSACLSGHITFLTPLRRGQVASGTLQSKSARHFLCSVKRITYRENDKSTDRRKSGEIVTLSQLLDLETGTIH